MRDFKDPTPTSPVQQVLPQPRTPRRRTEPSLTCPKAVPAPAPAAVQGAAGPAAPATTIPASAAPGKQGASVGAGAGTAPLQAGPTTGTQEKKPCEQRRCLLPTCCVSLLQHGPGQVQAPQPTPSLLNSCLLPHAAGGGCRAGLVAGDGAGGAAGGRCHELLSDGWPLAMDAMAPGAQAVHCTKLGFRGRWPCKLGRFWVEKLTSHGHGGRLAIAARTCAPALPPAAPCQLAGQGLAHS